MHWMKPLLLVGLVGFAARPTRVELMPADAMLQILPNAPDKTPSPEMKSRLPTRCSPRSEKRSKSIRWFAASRMSRRSAPLLFHQTAKDWDAVAISGRGLCYCSMLGNCRLWVYRQKKDKLQKIFATDSAAYFGFLSSRTGTPLLVVWTRESAVEQFAVVYKWDYGEYIEAASWKEVYEYEDADEEYRVHETPRIYSDMPLGVFLPD